MSRLGARTNPSTAAQNCPSRSQVLDDLENTLFDDPHRAVPRK